MFFSCLIYRKLKSHTHLHLSLFCFSCYLYRIQKVSISKLQYPREWRRTLKYSYTTHTFPSELHNDAPVHSAPLLVRSSAPIILRLVLTDARETSEGISAFSLLSRLDDASRICKVAACGLNLMKMTCHFVGCRTTFSRLNVLFRIEVRMGNVSNSIRHSRSVRTFRARLNHEIFHKKRLCRTLDG
jgi:hypothetical protein